METNIGGMSRRKGNVEANVGELNRRMGNAETNVGELSRSTGNGMEKLEELINQLKLYWLKFKYLFIFHQLI